MQSKYNEITRTTTQLSFPQRIYQTTSKQCTHLKRYPLPKKKNQGKKRCPQKIPYQHTPLIPSKKKKNETAEHKRQEEKRQKKHSLIHIVSPGSFVIRQSWGVVVAMIDYQFFFLANLLLRSASTFGTLNWTYSRSNSSWLFCCISRRSSNFRSSSRRPRLRPETIRSMVSLYIWPVG